jgi:hypothetical protein
MRFLLSLFLTLMISQSDSGSVEGIVLRAGTRQALPGVVVGLWPSNRTIKTDEEGKFKLENVPYGEYSLTVVHDGIKLQAPLLLSAAHRYDNVTLEVKPAPAITGTVFDPNGERAAGARVQALHNVYTANGPRLRSLMSVLTDDLGDFRLFKLRPGEYYVSASLNDRDRKASGVDLSPNVSKVDAGFPTIYFGGGYSPYQSQKVQLARDSDTEGVHIFLKDGPRFDLTGELSSDSAKTCARVAVLPEGGFITDKDFATDACGSFTVRGLSPGIYVVFAANESYASDVVHVNLLNGPPDKFVVTLTRTVSISGRVSGTSNEVVQSLVKLSRSSRDITQEFVTPVERDGTFTFQGVGQGIYDVNLDPLPDKSYVSSIRFRGAEAMTTPIRVDSSPPGRLDIQVARTDALAAGVVVDRSLKPVPGAQVVLVPRSVRPRADQYLTVTADGGGNFQIDGIPPIGNFLALAFEDIEPEAYFAFFNNAPLLIRYAGNGQLFNPSNSQPLRLFVIPASETAGGIR